MGSLGGGGVGGGWVGGMLTFIGLAHLRDATLLHVLFNLQLRDATLLHVDWGGGVGGWVGGMLTFIGLAHLLHLLFNLHHYVMLRCKNARRLTCPRPLFNPSEKYEIQLWFLFAIYGKIKNVPNHQPVIKYIWGLSSKNLDVGQT